MKTNKLMVLAVGGLMAIGSLTYAQDKKPEGAPKDKPPGEGAPAGGQRPNRQQFSPDQQLAKLSETLQLTDDQKPKVKAALESAAAKRKELRDATPEERQEKGKELRAEMNAKMKEILTPEQFEKFQKLPGPGQRRNGPPPGGAPNGEKPPKPEDKTN